MLTVVHNQKQLSVVERVGERSRHWTVGRFVDAEDGSQPVNSIWPTAGAGNYAKLFLGPARRIYQSRHLGPLSGSEPKLSDPGTALRPDRALAGSAWLVSVRNRYPAGWPVLSDRGVIVDSSALGEQVDGSGDHTFATREAHEQRVPIDWSVGAGVGQARPCVEDQAPVDVCGNLETAFDIALDEIVHHGLHGGNDGGHGLQIDSTPRTPTRALVGYPSWPLHDVGDDAVVKSLIARLLEVVPLTPPEPSFVQACTVLVLALVTDTAVAQDNLRSVRGHPVLSQRYGDDLASDPGESGCYGGEARGHGGRPAALSGFAGGARYLDL